MFVFNVTALLGGVEDETVLEAVLQYIAIWLNGVMPTTQYTPIFN